MNNEKNQTSSKKIQFKPLHEGMGFHPFSDGLPYAPASKTSASIPQKNQPISQPQISMNGTGAVSAGRPQFTTRTAPQFYQTKTTSLAAPDAIKPSMTSDHADQDLLTRKRIYAYMMDTVLHGGFWLITNLVALFAFDFQINLDLVKENFLQFLIFFSISQWMFIALQEMLFETTVGKFFFNLEFKRNHRSLLLRSIVFAIGAACLGLGLIFKWQDSLGKLAIKSKVNSK